MTEAGKKKGAARILIRYALLQVPMLSLVMVGLFLAHRYMGLPVWVVWGGIVAWLAKDILLFPLVRHSYDDRDLNNAHSMWGAEGRAVGRLDNSGHVLVRGVLWWAEVVGPRRTIEKGERVRVQGSRGLVLLVQSDDAEDARGRGAEACSGTVRVAPEAERLPGEGRDIK